MADALQFLTDLFVKKNQADEETTPNVACNVVIFPFFVFWQEKW